ncbi:MAG: pyruvate, phosphate dikinase [Deltaproteobacteria bacterium]|nr:pyruvate, phosphate dikinase [Deltaproteobacteria bacterium]MBW1921844.1 pyruvate, phosphate dikinase [Deltaproteobacteria bacterium]MBW1948007.1 pyruvate, phosphate dikinase [Deltaproteobacteria bacterium]MBW2008822.1 pyruvate, phosphate dikinase [Deltaproteobacteria bacterium]MBW2346922.1 pyruvate, phosphate dikinase [Deltaproteobacteria bacterium]
MPEKKWVYSFEEGDGKNKKLLGGKGANLCEMTRIGLPVPPGFVITTEACRHYLGKKKKELPATLMEQVRAAMMDLEKKTGKGFGDPRNPLLVSVRSGAAISMPGMMDTILNLGLNDDTVGGLKAKTGNERFVYDAYRRLIQLFGSVAMRIKDEYFDSVFSEIKNKYKVKHDVDMSAKALMDACEAFKAVFEERAGKSFPQDPYVQLETAIEAVFRSWMGKRAVDYRREFNITKEMADGTAVNICTMVFGNMGEDSATGVAFTRNPGSGENRLYGEYMVNAQGEDVVAGIRTPKQIRELRREMPEIYRQLEDLRHTLEQYYTEVQDFEFTIEKGKLYCLQTRNAKMTAAALIKTSIDMVNEGLISEEEAILRIQPDMLAQLLHPRLDPNADVPVLAQGLPASPGAASGKMVFDADRAETKAKLGEKVILVREETKPEDIHGFFASQGILTSRGGKTSHAAVVARSMGKPCVSGCEAIQIDHGAREAVIAGVKLREGDDITIDGSTGNIYKGGVPTIEPEFVEDLLVLLEWADDLSKVRVMANADTPEAVTKARKYGAMGIGLCRTERMFNQPERLPIVQEMILAETREERQAVLDRLLPYQREDFKEIFRIMDGLPVTIRLLDPPIHEFLPSADELVNEIVHLKELRKTVEGMAALPMTLKLMDPQLYEKYVANLEMITHGLEELKSKHLDEALIESRENMLRKVRALAETNPMLGHRGVRLGITYPEIYAMQIRAVLEAAAEHLTEGGAVSPEIMVPQVCTLEELKWVHKYVVRIHHEVEKQFRIKVPYKFGTMVEVVRACMRAGRLAELAEFISFGTNDLTQATFSFSREDAENKFLPLYKEHGILRHNPFEVLDIKGVGRLMLITIEWARKTRPDMKVGICGEQGGHPDAIMFCHHINIDYVSCSPPRVPIARLAAAQAKLKEKEYTF